MAIAEQIYEHAQRLVERPIPLRNRAGDSLGIVDGLVIGPYAIHQRPDRWPASQSVWYVTHIKSGAGGPSFHTPIEALIFIGCILGSGVHDRMRNEDETYQYDPKDVDPAVSARVRACYDELNRWDFGLAPPTRGSGRR